MEEMEGIRERRPLGSDREFGRLVNHSEVEAYYGSLKDEDGNTWPYTVEYCVAGGQVSKDDFFSVEKQSFFKSELIIFSSVDALNAYLREQIKVNKI